MVVWAGLFAVMAIGTAVATHYFENKKNTSNIVAAGSNIADWKSVSNFVNADGSNAALSSGQISKDLYSSYLALAQKGQFTAAEKDKMISDLVERHVTNPAVVPNITVSNLNVQAGVSITKYAELFAVIMSQASQAKQYELDLFTRTVAARNVNGTPALQESANLYLRIAAALLVMEVPPEVAVEHLEVVKSVGALGRVVDVMANWHGDPIQALEEVDVFNKTENYVSVSVDVLVSKIITLQKAL